MKVNDLSIDDFEWETKRTKYNGADYYSFTLTNNSVYDIINVEFTYKVKDDVNDSDLEVYSEFMKKHDRFIEEGDSPKDVILVGSKNSLVPTGEQLTDLIFTVGLRHGSWYDYPTDEQFNLMEPKKMQINIIGKDNVLYFAYYDFEDAEWMLVGDTMLVDTWSEKAIANRISKPVAAHHIVTMDYEDEFQVYAYGTKEDEYNQYVETLKTSGFKEKSRNFYSFVGENEDGYTVAVYYYSDEEKMSINVDDYIQGNSRFYI